MPRDPVNPDEVRLEEGTGSAGRGGGPGGHYWHVFDGGKRVGHVYINVIDEEPVGRHASIQIQINKTDQRRGIGKVAYRMAAERSSYDTIFAHMRKSNTGSRKAAEAAGFDVVDDERVRQLLMRWKRA